MSPGLPRVGWGISEIDLEDRELTPIEPVENIRRRDTQHWVHAYGFDVLTWASRKCGVGESKIESESLDGKAWTIER